MRGADLLPKKKYTWKTGYRLRGNPTLVGRRIEEITKKNGACSREDIYADARRGGSPFHADLYSKTSSEMVREWRLEKASEILRAIQIVEIEIVGGVKTEVAGPLVSFIPNRDYLLTTKVLHDSDLRRERLAQIIRELEVFKYKLYGFRKLAEMVDRVIRAAKKTKK